LPTLLDTIKARIRQAGLRSTAPRIAVLRYMETLDTPNSHAAIADALGPEGFDRTTIYRNLTDMAEVGLLARVNLGENVWHFEVRQDGEQTSGVEHPHFVCVECGAVSCLQEVSVEIKHNPDSNHPTVVEILEVLIKGRCQDCVAPEV
jgi:Fur family ferric uptake transcriptional regulator